MYKYLISTSYLAKHESMQNFQKTCAKALIFFSIYGCIWRVVEPVCITIISTVFFSRLLIVIFTNVVLSFTIIMLSGRVLCYIPYTSFLHTHTYMHLEKGVHCSRKGGGSLACLSRKYFSNHTKNN